MITKKTKKNTNSLSFANDTIEDKIDVIRLAHKIKLDSMPTTIMIYNVRLVSPRKHIELTGIHHDFAGHTCFSIE